MNRTDEQLVADYLGGDEKSLETLFRRWLKPIYSFSYRYTNANKDAEDIAQDVFVKTWKNLKKFDRNRKFKTWIFQIAKNTCIDWQRKKKSFPLYSAENIKDPAPSPAPVSESLDKILERLSPKYRMVLFLRYNDHFTFREIAESLGEPLNTIKSRHRRALIILKKLLSSYFRVSERGREAEQEDAPKGVPFSY